MNAAFEIALVTYQEKVLDGLVDLYCNYKHKTESVQEVKRYAPSVLEVWQDLAREMQKKDLSPTDEDHDKFFSGLLIPTDYQLTDAEAEAIFTLFQKEIKEIGESRLDS